MDHVHFQRNSSTSGGTGTPQIAVAFTMDGFSSLNDSVENGNTATSDNLSAGYSSAFAWEQAIHDKYLAKGGVDVVGSSAWITAWEPGNAGSGGCWPGLTSGWYSCTVNGRSGKVQTFKGVGSGNGEHAILKGSALSAAFLSRGLLGGFTDPFDASGNDGLWWMGYPISDSYSIGGGRYEMDFQNGYAYYTPYPSCLAQFYAGGVLKLSTSAYCG